MKNEKSKGNKIELDKIMTVIHIKKAELKIEVLNKNTYLDIAN